MGHISLWSTDVKFLSYSEGKVYETKDVKENILT
jgi:hypothetical protein